jgi:long-chain acyl-CoA synthetase
MEKGNMQDSGQNSEYSEKIWKKRWDPGLKDLDPEVFEQSVIEAFKDTFENYADSLAFSFMGLEINYSVVEERSNQFANMLIDTGFKKGDIVGINLPNIPEYLISAIGALKVGCIVSGISPLLSDMQMLYQINDLGAGQKNVALVTLDAIFEGRLTKIASKTPDLKLVVATSIIGSFPKEQQEKIRAVREIPSGKVTSLEDITVMDYWDDVIAKYNSNPVNIKISPDELGFIQYTGGTTGPAKGAMLTHRNVVANMNISNAWLHLEKGVSGAVSGFPFFHIAGLSMGLNTIYNATFQVLIPDPRDTLTINNAIKQYKPRLLVNVPSLYQLLMNTRKFKRLDHSTLETCISGASPFPVESQKNLESIVGKGKLLEAYGMTESTALISMNPFEGEKKLGTVGIPLLNFDIKIVDPDTGREVPLGQPGEICAKGPMIMVGYYNKPEETKNSIIDGYMHTGDVGVMDEDGYITIVDRTKDMIIVGGFKVFSAKLEDTLTKHPAIGTIATIGIPNPDRPGSEIVKAYIQIDPNYEYDGNETALKTDITKFAKENCAPYEVPKIIEFSQELPLTAVGKIDKKQLRK